MRHTCSTCRFCNGEDEYEPCENCEVISVDEFSNWEPPKITNADRIRSMTDEELAEWLAKNDPECDPAEWWLEWLKEEVKDG